MSKKVHFATAQHVLVIEDKHHFECAVNALVQLGVNFKTPGALLASFKGLVHKFDLSEIQSGDRQGLIIIPDGLSKENYQLVHILILSPKGKDEKANT